MFTLAAAYAFGLTRNHPFVDGNKRMALTAAAVFLADNIFDLAPDDLDALNTVPAPAAGEVEDDDLVDWIEAHAYPTSED